MNHLDPNKNLITITPVSLSLNSSFISSTNNRFEYTNNIATKYIWPIVPIGFLILGTIANILSIIIFTRREMRKFSSFCYFAFLNLTNLAVLYVTLIRVIMNYNFDLDIRKLNIFACKLHVFLTYFLGHLSSLLLSTISIDRVISVMFLHKAKDLCTPRVAYIVTIVLVIFNFVLSSHLLIFETGFKKLKTINENSFDFEIICETKPNTTYDKFVGSIWKIIDAIFYAFIPFIIMLTSSVIIIIRVAQQSKKFDKRQQSVKNGSLNKNGLMKKSDTINGSKMNLANNNNNNNVSSKSSIDTKFSTRTRNLALMLIPVNILFLAFLAPVVLTIYIYDDLSKDELTLAIVELLSYCNFTFNFFIYFITSSKFREEFFKFFDEIYINFNLKLNLNNINTNGQTQYTNVSLFNSAARSDKINKTINNYNCNNNNNNNNNNTELKVLLPNNSDYNNNNNNLIINNQLKPFSNFSNDQNKLVKFQNSNSINSINKNNNQFDEKL